MGYGKACDSGWISEDRSCGCGLGSLQSNLVNGIRGRSKQSDGLSLSALTEVEAQGLLSRTVLKRGSVGSWLGNTNPRGLRPAAIS